jgi:hypothetical protein
VLNGVIFCVKERLLKYLKNNRIFLIVMILGAIALAIQMINVALYADDFTLGSISPSGLPGMFEYSVEHYLNWGGGYTPGMVITLLMFHPIIWKLLIVVLVSLFISMTSRMISKDDIKRRAMIAAILWILFFGLSIYLTSETIYWLDGAMAYLFSSFQALLVFYFLYSRLSMGDKKKYDVVLLPLVCFLGGWSSAQSGAAAVLIALILVAYKKFIKKEKVNALCWTSLALTLIGFAIFYFAPGNNSRMGTFAEFSAMSLPQKVLYRIPDIFSLLFNGRYYDVTASSLFIYLAIGLVALFSLEKARAEKNKKLRILAYICSACGLLFVIGYAISCLPIPKISEITERVYSYRELLGAGFNLKFLISLIPYAIATVAIIATIINAWLIGHKENKRPFLLTAILVTFATELIMFMSPYSPIRTAFYSVMFALCAIAYVLYECMEYKVRIFPIALIILMFVSPYFGLLYALLYVLYITILKPKDKDKYRIDIFIFAAIVGLYALGNYGANVRGYYNNRQIFDTNVNRINEFKNSGQDCSESCVLYLLPPVDEKHGFTGMVGIDWIEESVIDYYDLPENVDLVYEEVAE